MLGTSRSVFMECREQMTDVLIGGRSCNIVPANTLAASCTVQLCINQVFCSVTKNAPKGTAIIQVAHTIIIRTWFTHRETCLLVSYCGQIVQREL
jgi:hypothetical protein